MPVMTPKGPLADSETVIFLDKKNREYLRKLQKGKPIVLRGGKIPGEEIIGRSEGIVVRTSANEPYVVLRPTLAQLIPNLPRQAQVIYPKDIGLILVWADIFPGATVIEAGVGPGALTLALLRAVGPEGRLISYEIRPDFAEMARNNIDRFYGPASSWKLKIADARTEMEEKEVDRIILDLPDPWSVVEHSWQALRPGGTLLTYLPTILQVKNLVDALVQHGGFAKIETLESLTRHWHIKDVSVRPEHRMVAHTGFITLARKVAGK